MIIFIFTFCNISRTRLVKTTSKEFAASSIESLTPTYTSSFHNIESSTFPQSHDPYPPSDANRPPSPGDQFRHGRSVSIASIKSSVTVHFNENKLDEKSRSVSFPVIKQPQEIRIKEDESSRLTKEPEKAKEYTEYYEDQNTKVKIDREKSNVEITKRETVEKDEQVYKIKQIVVVSVDDKKQKENDRTSDTEMNDSHEISDKEYSESCDTTESVNQKSDEEGSERTLSPISDTELTDTVEIEEKHGTIIKGVETQKENDVKSKEEKSVTIGDVQIMNAKRHGHLKPLTKTPSSEIDKSKRRRKRLERGKLEETNEERLSKEIVRVTDDKEKEISVTEQALEDLGKGAQDDGDKEIECVIGDTAVPRTVIKDAKKSVDHSQKEVSKSKPTSNIDELVLHQKIDKGEVTTDEDETKDDYEDDFEEEDINISLREESPRKENEPVETTAQVDVAANEESYKKTTEKQKIDEINVVQEVKENLSFSQHGQRDDETEDTKLQVSSNKLNIIDRPEEKLSSVISQKIEEDKRLSEAKLEKTVLEIKLGKQKEGTEVREGKEREMESLLGIPVHVPSSEKSEESGNTKVEMSDTSQTRKEIVSEKQETVKERNLHRLHISNSSVNTLIITRDTLYPEQKELQEHINSLIGTETVSKSKKDIQLESTEITNNVSLESSNSKATKKMISCGNKSFATQTISSQATQTINSIQIQTVNEMQTQTTESTSTQTTTAAEAQTEKQGRISISSVDSNQVAEYAKENARQVDMIDVATSPVPETLFVLKRHQSENILTDSIVTRSSIEEKRHIKELDILLDKTIESVTKEPEHKNEEPQEGVTKEAEHEDEESASERDEKRESETKGPEHKDGIPDKQNDQTQEILTRAPEHKDDMPDDQKDKTHEIVTIELEHKDGLPDSLSEKAHKIVTTEHEQKGEEPDSLHEKTQEGLAKQPEHKDKEADSQHDKTRERVTKEPEHKDSIPDNQNDQAEEFVTTGPNYRNDKTQEIFTTEPEHKDKHGDSLHDKTQEGLTKQPEHKDEESACEHDKNRESVTKVPEHEESMLDSRSDKTHKIVTTAPEQKDDEPYGQHDKTQQGVTTKPEYKGEEADSQRDYQHKDEESACERDKDILPDNKNDQTQEIVTTESEHKDSVPDYQKDKTHKIVTIEPEHKDEEPDKQRDKTHEGATTEPEHKKSLTDSLSDKTHKIVCLHTKGEELNSSVHEKYQEVVTTEPEHKNEEADNQGDNTQESLTKEPEHKDIVPDNQNDQTQEIVTTKPEQIDSVTDYQNDKAQEIVTKEPEQNDEHGIIVRDKTQECVTSQSEHKDGVHDYHNDTTQERVTTEPEHKGEEPDSLRDKTQGATTEPEHKDEESSSEHYKKRECVTKDPEHKAIASNSRSDKTHTIVTTEPEQKDEEPDSLNDKTQERITDVTTEPEHKGEGSTSKHDKTYESVTKEPEHKDSVPDNQNAQTLEIVTTEPKNKDIVPDYQKDQTQEIVTIELEHKNRVLDNQNDNTHEIVIKEPKNKDEKPDKQRNKTQIAVTTEPEHKNSTPDHQNDKTQEIITTEPKHKDEEPDKQREKTQEGVTTEPEHKGCLSDSWSDKAREIVTTESEQKNEMPERIHEKHQKGVTVDHKNKGEKPDSQRDKKRDSVTKEAEYKDCEPDNQSDQTQEFVTTEPKHKDSGPDYQTNQKQEIGTKEPRYKYEHANSLRNKTQESVTTESEHKDEEPDSLRDKTQEGVTTETEYKDEEPDSLRDKTQESVTTELEHKDEEPDKLCDITQGVTSEPEHADEHVDGLRDKTQEGVTTEPEHKDEEPDSLRDKTQEGVTTEPEHKDEEPDSLRDITQEGVTTEPEHKDEEPDKLRDITQEGVTKEPEHKDQEPDNLREKTQEGIKTEPEHKDEEPDKLRDIAQEGVTTEPEHKDEESEKLREIIREGVTTEPEHKDQEPDNLREKTQEGIKTEPEHKDEEPDKLRDIAQEGVTTEPEHKDEEPDNVREKTQEGIKTEPEHKNEEPDKLHDIAQKGVTTQPEHKDEESDKLRDITQEGITTEPEHKDEEPDNLREITQEGVTTEPEHKDEEPDKLRDITQEGVTTRPEHKDEEPDKLRGITQESVTTEPEHKDEESDKLCDITQEGVTTEPERKDEESDKLCDITQEGVTTEPEHKDEEPDNLRDITQEGVTTEPEHKDEEPHNLREITQDGVTTEPEHKDQEPDNLREKTQEGIKTEPEHKDEEPDKLRDIAQEGVTKEPDHKDEEPDKLRDITQEGVTTEPEHKDEESDKLRDITQEGVTTEPEHKDEEPENLREKTQEGIKTEPEHKDEEPDKLRDIAQEGVTTEPEHKDEESDKLRDITQEGVTTEPEHKDEQPDKLRDITQEGVTTEPEHKDEESDKLCDITQEGITTEPECKDEESDKLCDITQEGVTTEPEHRDEEPDNLRDITQEGVTTEPEHKDEEPDNLREITQEGVTTEPEHKDEEPDNLRKKTQEGIKTEPEHKDEEPDKLRDIAQEGVTKEPDHKDEEPDKKRDITQEGDTTEPEHKDKESDKVRDITQEGVATEPEHKDEEPDNLREITQEGVTTEPKHKDEEPDRLREKTQKSITTEPEHKDEEPDKLIDIAQEGVTTEPEHKDEEPDKLREKAQEGVTTEPEHKDEKPDKLHDKTQEGFTTEPEHKDEKPDKQRDITHKGVTTMPEHKDEEPDRLRDITQEGVTTKHEHKDEEPDNLLEITQECVTTEPEHKDEEPDKLRDITQEGVTTEPEHKDEESASEHDKKQESVTKEPEQKDSVLENKIDQAQQIVTTEPEQTDTVHDYENDQIQETITTKPGHKDSVPDYQNDKTHEIITIEPEHKDEECEKQCDKAQDGATIDPEHKKNLYDSQSDKTHKIVIIESEEKVEESDSPHDKSQEDVRIQPEHKIEEPDSQHDKTRASVTKKLEDKGSVPDNQNDRKHEIVTTELEHNDENDDNIGDKTQEGVKTEPEHKGEETRTLHDRRQEGVTIEPEHKDEEPDSLRDKTQGVTIEPEYKDEEPNSLCDKTQKGVTTEPEYKDEECASDHEKQRESVSKDSVPDNQSDKIQEIVKTEPKHKGIVPDNQNEKTQKIITTEAEHKDGLPDYQNDKTQESVTTELKHKDNLADSRSDKTHKIVTTEPKQKDSVPDYQNDKTQECVSTELEHKIEEPHSQRGKTPGSETKETENKDIVPDYHKDQSQEIVTTEPEQKNSVPDQEKTQKIIRREPEHKDEEPDKQRDITEEDATTETEHKDSLSDSWSDKAREIVTTQPEQKDIAPDNQNDKTQECVTKEPKHEDNVPDNQSDQTPRTVKTEPEQRERELENLSNKTHETPIIQTEHNVNQNDKTQETETAKPDRLDKKPDIQNEKAQTIVATEHDNKDRELDLLINKKDTTIKIDPENKEKELDDQSTKTQETLTTEPEHKDSEPDNQSDTLPESVTKNSGDKVKEPNDQCDKTQESITRGPGRKDSVPENQRDKTDEVVSTEPEHVFEGPDSQHDRTKEGVKQYTSQERGTKEPYNSEKTVGSNQSGYPETIVETESYKHSTQLQINMSADSSLEFIEKLTELKVLDNQKVNDTNELDKNDGENIQYYSPACEPIESIPAMIPAYLGVDSNESCVEMVALESESKCDILYLPKGVLKTELESMDKAFDAYSESNDVNLLHISASVSEKTDGKTNQTVLFDHSQRKTSDKDFIEQGLSEKDAKGTIPGVDNYPEISEMKYQKVTVDVADVDEQEDKQEKAKSERDTGNQTIMKTDKDSKETKDGLNHSDIEISSTLEDIKDLQELKSSSTELSDNSYSYETTFDETSPEKSQAETTDKLSSLVSDSDRKDLNESKSEHYNSTDEIFDIITDKQSIVEATEEAESSIYENVIEKEQLNDHSVQSSPKQVTEGEQCQIKSTHKRSQAIMNDAQGQSVKTSPEIIKEPIDTEEDIQKGDCNNEAPIKEEVFEEDNVDEKSSKGKIQESLTSEFYTNTSKSNAATEYMFPEQGHVLQGDKQDDIIERENIIINETESNIPVSSREGKSVCLSAKDIYQKLETTQESSECYIKETFGKLIPQPAVDSFEGKNHSNDDTVEKSLRRLENEYVSFELDTKPTDDISLTSGNASQTPEMRNYKISKENDREEQDLKQEINALTIEDVTEGRRSIQVEYLSESKGEGLTDTMINKVSDMKPDTYSKEKRLEKDNSGNYINLIDETTKLESDQSESYYIKQTSGDESLLSGLSLENDDQMTKQTDTYSKPPMQLVEGNDKDHLRPVNKNELTPSDNKVHMKEKIATTDEARLINVLKHNLGDSKEILPENKCDKNSKEILEGNLETCSQDDTFTTVSTLTSTSKFTDTVLDNFEQENGFKRNEHREDKHAYHSASGFEDLAPSTYDQSSSPKEYYKLESTIPEETGHQIHDKQTLNEEQTECMADLSNLGISDIFESVTNRDNESVDIYNQDTSQGISDISEASLEGPGGKTDHDEAQKQELQLDGSHTNDVLDPLAPNESQSEISPQLESSNELKDAQLLLHQSSTKPEFTCTTYIAESSSTTNGKSDAIEVSDKQAQVECISMTYSVVDHDGQKSESADSRITDNSLLNVNVIQDELPKKEGMSKNTTIPISSNKVNETSLILDKSTTKQDSTFTTHTNESTSKIHIDVSGTKDVSESSNQVESTPQALDESALKPEQSNGKTVIGEPTSSNDIDDSTPDFKDVIDEGIATEAIPEIETTPKVSGEFKDEDLVVDQGATMPERFDLKDIDKSTSAKHFDGSHGNNVQNKQAQTQLTLEGEDSPKSSNQLRDDELVINQSSRNLESSCTIVIDEAGLHLKEEPNEQSQTEASSSQNKFTPESSKELKKAESNIDQNIWDQKTTGTTFIADSTDYKENDKFRLEVNGVSGEQANREGTPDLEPTLVSYDGEIVSDQSALIPEYDDTKDIDKSTSEILIDVSDANEERDKPAQIQVTSEKKSTPSNEIEDTELVSDPCMKELASSSMIVMDNSTSLTHLENSSLKLITDTQVLYESLSEMESTAKSPKELKDTKLKKHQGTITHESSGNTFIDEPTSTKYMNTSKSEFNDVLNEQAQTEAQSEIEPISQLCSELKEGESVLEQSATMPEPNDLKNVHASTAIVNLDVSNVRDVQETLAQSLKSESDPSLESSMEIKDPRLVIDCSTKKPESFSIAATDEATSSLQLEGSAFKEIPDVHGRNEVQAEMDAKAEISKEVKESELNIDRTILEKESIVTITIGELTDLKDMDKSASDAGDVSDKHSQKEASSDSCSELKVANSISDKSGMMAEYNKAKSIEATSEIESLPVSSNELTDADLLLTQSSMNSESTHSTVMDESHGSKDNVESTSISKDVLNEEAEKEATSQIKPYLESCNELDVIDQNTMKRTSSESTAIGESIGVKDINETTTDLKHVQDEQALIKVTTDLEPNFESYNEFKDENLVIDPSATRTESTYMKDIHDSVTKIQYDSLDFKLVPDQKISRESESNMELRLETSSELKDTTAVIEQSVKKHGSAASKTNDGSLSDNKDESQRAVIKETFEIEHSPESPYELKEGETKAEQCRTKAEFIDTTETGESTSMKQFDESEVNCALDKQDRKVASSDINITPGSPTELKVTKSVIDQNKLKPELIKRIGETTCPTEIEESTTNFKEISDNQSKTDLTDPESTSKLCEELKDRHVVLNQTVTNQEYICVKDIDASSSNTQLECPHENDVQEKNTLTEETSEMDPNKLKDDDSVTNQSNLKVGSTYSAVISESTSSTDLDESSKKLDLKVVIENQPQRKVKTGNLSTSESYDAFKDAKSDIDHRSATYPKSAYPKEIHESPCKVQSESDLNNVTDKQAPTEANSETDPTIESKEKLGVDNSGISFGTSTDSNQITGPTTGSCNELKDEEAVSDENTTNSESVSMKHVDESASNKQSESLGPNVNSVLEKLTLSEIKSHIELKPKSDCTISDNIEPKSTFQDGPDEQVQTEIKREIEPTLELYDNLQDVKSVEDKSTTIPESANSKDESTSYKKLIMQDVTDVPDKQALTELTSEMELKTNSADNLKYDNPVTNQRESKPESVSITIGEFTGMKDIDELSSDLKDVSSGKANTEAETETEPVSESCNMLKDEKILANQTVMNPESTYLKENCGSTPNLQLEMPDVNNVQDKQASKEATSEMDPTPEPAEKLKRDDSLNRQSDLKLESADSIVVSESTAFKEIGDSSRYLKDASDMQAQTDIKTAIETKPESCGDLKDEESIVYQSATNQESTFLKDVDKSTSHIKKLEGSDVKDIPTKAISEMKPMSESANESDQSATKPEYTGFAVIEETISKKNEVTDMQAPTDAASEKEPKPVLSVEMNDSKSFEDESQRLIDISEPTPDTKDLPGKQAQLGGASGIAPGVDSSIELKCTGSVITQKATETDSTGNSDTGDSTFKIQWDGSGIKDLSNNEDLTDPTFGIKPELKTSNIWEESKSATDRSFTEPESTGTTDTGKSTSSVQLDGSNVKDKYDKQPPTLIISEAKSIKVAPDLVKDGETVMKQRTEKHESIESKDKNESLPKRQVGESESKDTLVDPALVHVTSETDSTPRSSSEDTSYTDTFETLSDGQTTQESRFQTSQTSGKVTSQISGDIKESATTELRRSSLSDLEELPLE